VPLLPASPGCPVLVTSQRVLIVLDGAIAFTRTCCGRTRPWRCSVRWLAGVASPPTCWRHKRSPGRARTCRWRCGSPGHVWLRGPAGRSVPWRIAWPTPSTGWTSWALGDLGVRTSSRVSHQERDNGADTVDRAAAAAALGLLGDAERADIITAAAARLLDRVQLETERALEPLVDAAALETTSPGRRRRPGHPCPAPTRRCSRSPRPRAASPRPLRGEAGIPPQQDQRGVPTGLELPSRADVSSRAGAAPSHPGRDGLLGDGWRLELGHGVGLDLVLVLQPVVEDPQGSGTGSRPCRACGARAVHRGTLRYPRCGRRQGRPALPLGGARRAGREPPGGCGWCATLPAAIGRGETAGQP